MLPCTIEFKTIYLLLQFTYYVSTIYVCGYQIFVQQPLICLLKLMTGTKNVNVLLVGVSSHIIISHIYFVLYNVQTSPTKENLAIVGVFELCCKTSLVFQIQNCKEL